MPMQDRSFVPRGAASLKIAYDGPPRDYHFLLLPKLTLLAFTSALEPLRVANQVTGKELYRWYVMTEDDATVTCSCGVTITPDTPLRDVPRGGAAFVCGGIEPNESTSRRAVGWVSRQRAFGARVGGICTGAFALARAGLLEGRRFTLHWENQPGFVETFPGLVPKRSRVVVDGDLLTCSGGSAATEMMLKIIEDDHGEDFAIAVSDMCLNSSSGDIEREQRSSIAKAISSRNPKLLHILREMYANIEEPLSLEDLARNANVSRRQMERLFTNALEETPAATYRNIKLDKARALFSETDMTVIEVAIATGFTSPSILSRSYKARFGETPYGRSRKR